MTLLWLSGAFVVGALLVLTPGGGWSPPPGLALFLWAAAIVFVVIRERAMHRRLLPVMVGLLLVLGLIRVSLSDQSLPPENLPGAFHAGAIAFAAILITEPRPYGGATRLPLSVLKVFDADGNAVELDPPIAIDVLADRLFGTLDRGDMILVETPGDRRVLIDGGRDVDGATAALGRVLPFWERGIDVVVLTHSDADHVGGLIDVLDRYQVGAVVDTTAYADSAVFGEWRDRLLAPSAPVVVAREGLMIDLDSDVTLEVIWAGTPELSDTNAASTVLILRHGDVRMLLTGDIPKSVETRLVDSDVQLDADPLKAPHHGSDTSSSKAFLEAVDPSVIVIPVGERNPLGHPDEDVLARYANVVPDAPVFVAKEHGDVTVESDGTRLWVTTER